MVKIKGGAGGASEYGTYVWGMQQHAGQHDNVIQAVGDPTKYTGGRQMGGRQMGGRQMGGSMMAVPAILLTANHLYRPKYNKKHKGPVRINKYKGGNIQSQLAQLATMQEGANAALSMLNPTVPSVINSDSPPPYKGGGIVTNIAVPTLLVAANNLYKKKRTARKKSNHRRRYSSKKR